MSCYLRPLVLPLGRALFLDLVRCYDEEEFGQVTKFVNSQAFYTPVLSMADTIIFAKLVNSQAFGTHLLGFLLEPTKLTNSQTFGAPSASILMAGTKLANAQAFGTHLLSVLLEATKLTNSQAFGTTQVVVLPALTKLVNASTLRAPTASVRMLETKLVNAQAFGVPHIFVGELTATKFVDVESFPPHALSMSLPVTLLTNSQAFGSHAITEAIMLAATKLVNSQTFGAPAMSVLMTGTKFTNAQAFGTHLMGFLLEPTKLTNSQTIYAPAASIQMLGTKFANAQVFGAPSMSVLLEATKFVDVESFPPHVIEEVAGGGELSISVAASADDARQSTSNGAMTLDGTELAWNTVTAHYAVRFQNVTIPPGATITSATIQFTASVNGTGSTTLETFGFLGNPGEFTTTTNDISDRSITTEKVDWVTGTWTAGDRTSAQLIDVTAIMQEIVDDGGWSSGNATGFRLTKTSANANRGAAYDHATHAPATLDVTWE